GAVGLPPQLPEVLQHTERAAPAEPLAPVEWPDRPVVAQPHRGVDVVRGGDPLPESEAGLVGDRRAEPGQDLDGVLTGEVLERLLVEDRTLTPDVGIAGAVGSVRLIRIEAAARLPAEPAGGDHALVDHGGSPARLAEGLLPERFGDREVD